MSDRSAFVLGTFIALSWVGVAVADPVQVAGKIIRTGAHQNPACRMVTVKRNDNGQLIHFRLPNIASETSLSAMTITALTTGYNVVVSYDPAIGSGCGTEPVISWIDLYAPGFGN